MNDKKDLIAGIITLVIGIPMFYIFAVVVALY